MLHLSPHPVQSIAPGMLKWGREYVRQPAGAAQGKGGEFAANLTHARGAEAEQLQKALVETTLAVPAVKILTGHDPVHPLAVAASPFYGYGKTGDPTTFTREVRGLVKQQIQKDLTERLRNNPLFADMGPPMHPHGIEGWVHETIDRWAETSGDGDELAIKMQEAVQKEFDLPKEGMQHFPDTGLHNELEEARERAFVRAEYERTQEWFKAQGMTHVSVFRGMGNSHADVELGFTNVLQQPASSWATSLEIAMLFAETRDNPILLTTRVPVEQVLSTAVTGRGCLTETEIILLGKGEQRVRVFDLDDERPDEQHGEWRKNKRERILASLK